MAVANSMSKFNSMINLARLLSICILCIYSLSVESQSLKAMDETAYDIWKTIENVQISNDGNWVSYELTPGDGDKSLNVYDVKNAKTLNFNRGTSAKIDFENNFIAFLIKPHQDSIKSLKRKKEEEDNFPKDSLGFYDFNRNKLIKIPNVLSFSIPKEKSGLLAYHLSPKKIENDSSIVKKETNENGSSLVIRNFDRNTEDTLRFITDYIWSRPGNLLSAVSTGKDSTEFDQLSIYESRSGKNRNLFEQKAKIKNLSFNKKGDALSFLADTDTTELKQRPYELHLWQLGESKANKIADIHAKFLDKDWTISKKKKAQFSPDSKHLIFGIEPKPFEIDTNLLEDEIVNVEVWHYKDELLHTEQKVHIKNNEDDHFLVSYDLKRKRFVRLSDETFTETKFSKNESKYALIYDQKSHKRSFSWEGILYKDVYVVNLETGKRTLVANKAEGNFSLSPMGKYVYWYSRPDSSWKSFNIKTSSTTEIAGNESSIFYSELNDRPMLPYSYGSSIWLGNDEYVLIYDRYDIWKIDPDGKKKPVNLTKGRKKKISYRHVSLDNEIKTFPLDTSILLNAFDAKTKSASFAELQKMKKPELLIPFEEMQVGRRVYKAKSANALVFTKENFETFPDLLYSKSDFKNPKKISSANPQQKEYNWGTAELIKWKSPDGKEHEGMLYKPSNFDIKQKYPLLVNFYEKSSDRLHRHRAPFPHRSTINYSFYVSKGYVIFNPDIHYKIGYPGESCYNSVMSGLDVVIDMGFIDEENIGVQGHSWGGYQIAHLLTKTNKFKCAESGAPVVNMFSAYGGIRWRSGLSRMFQYEHTQSRIGGTIWDSKDLYEENSPIFNMDKVQTPVLIMHNDKDGAVPWYQGIEYFVALRRLDKPAWLLNYNNEPHWPVKRQNRIDFNIRMAQFFDYYLKDAPMPKWMKSGVPAKEKGINQGLELLK